MKVLRFILTYLLIFSTFSCIEKGYVEDNYTASSPIYGSGITGILIPTSGAYSNGSGLDFQITYDDIITVTGSPCVLIIIGSSTRSACYQSGSASNTLTFSYTVQAGENDANGIAFYSTNIELNSGSLKDSLLGNANISFRNVTPSLSSITVNTAITPADAVATVTQTNLTSDRMQVSFSWTQPADNGTPITKYIVRYKKQVDTLYTYLAPEPLTESATITALDIETLYDIQVAAYNGVIGPYSSALEVSTFFTPKTLGALIWFEAKDLNGDGNAVADGTAFTRMTDKSGNDNHADKISGTSATIETEAGYKVMRMTSSGYRTINSLGEAANTDIEVYIVAKTRVISSSFAFSNENEGNSNRYGTHFPWSNGNAYIDLPIGNRMSGAWGGNTTDFFAWTFRSSTTLGKTLERDGVSILTAGNKVLTPPLKKWSIGSQYSGTGNYWKADMQAIFVFGKVLNALQRQEFFDFIEGEYGVVMP